MSRLVASSHTKRFRRAVSGSLGLRFDDTRLGFLAEVLERRLAATGQQPDVYLAGLEAGGAGREVGALAEELTVAETSFFRNADQFRALVETVLPALVRARATVRQLRILSAGCASGEETYSLAIVLKEAGIDPSWDVSLLGVDVNPVVLRKAAHGRFSAWALRETPHHLQHRWFRRDGQTFVLDESVRAIPRFEERNLVHDNPQLWPADTYDVIFFRNVLMYFTRDQTRSLLGRLARSLRAGGHLFIGYAETLRGLSNEFLLRHTHGTFYYERSDSLGPPAIAPPQPAGDVAAANDDREEWFETVRRSSDRIGALTALPTHLAAPRAVATSGAAPWDLGVTFALVRDERFAEALETLQGLPAEAGRDPDVLLLRAALLAHGGRLVDAETSCRRLLEVDGLSAGAHYLLALCREGAGDGPSALQHDRIAIHLDPGFAMPRLHLGLLARRAGDDDSARRELQEASLLLQREDGARMLLFGGGFSRDTLIGICRAELAGCGGAA